MSRVALLFRNHGFVDPVELKYKEPSDLCATVERMAGSFQVVKYDYLQHGYTCFMFDQGGLNVGALSYGISTDHTLVLAHHTQDVRITDQKKIFDELDVEKPTLATVLRPIGLRARIKTKPPPPCPNL